MINRKEIDVQLKLNRALLFRQLLGLDAERLNIPIWDDYSIRLILPHIGRWDTFEAERIASLTVGDWRSIEWVPVEERNAAFHAQDQAITIDDGVALMLAERVKLHQAIDNAPDKLLKSTVTVSEDFQLPVMRGITNSIEHDEDHTADIEKWREAQGFRDWVHGPKSILQGALEANRDALSALVALFEDRPIQIEDWGIREVIAHLIGWEENMVASLAVGVDQRPSDDFHEANQGFVNAAENTAIDELLDHYKKSRRATIAFVTGRTDEDLKTDFNAFLQRITTQYLWICLHAAHEADHLRELYTAYLMQSRVKQKKK